MARARNNIARLGFEQRIMVCGWLADALSYDTIRAKLAAIFNAEDMPELHNSSFLAYQNSAEYKKYLDERLKLDKKLQPRRLAAEIINNGRGVESAADVAALELLEQIQQLSGAGLEVSDIQKLASAAVSLKRSTVSAKEKSLQAELDKIKAQYAAEVAELQSEIARLNGEKTAVAKDKGLSEESLKRIEEQAGLM